MAASATDKPEAKKETMKSGLVGNIHGQDVEAAAADANTSKS